MLTLRGTGGQIAAWTFQLAKASLESDPVWIDTKADWPQLTRSIAYKWLDEGLHDRGITRDLDWGIPVDPVDFPELEAEANQSYGIQVAALAGIPNAVVRAARKQLREFEQRAAVDPLQPDLFAQGDPEPAEAEPHPAVEQLTALDPDRLTPREALDALYALKALLK